MKENFESKKKLWKDKYEIDSEGYVRFGDISRGEMDLQSQYGSRYIDGKLKGYPNLGEGLRFKGEAYDYHAVKIHSEDIEEFLKRFHEYENRRLKS